MNQSAAARHVVADGDCGEEVEGGRSGMPDEGKGETTE